MGVKQTKITDLCSDPISKTNGHHELETYIEDRDLLQNGTPLRSADNLRRRFFKGFTYNLNDPRSPSYQLNRTPLIFENKSDKTLNLDDTFSDLFVTNQVYGFEKNETSTSKDKNINQDLHRNDFKTASINFENFEASLPSYFASESTSVEFVSLHEEETMPSPAVLQKTPLVLQQSLDPRSPTIGLTRTPLVFDDDEAQEDALLEDILTTLSLEYGTPNSSISSERAEKNNLFVDVKPINKHLDRVRTAKKPEKPIRKIKHFQKQRIYLDTENTKLTPIRKSSLVSASPKRTPLSCVKNRVHLRSRSVESNDKSSKPKLYFASYDDNLYPVQD